jgi:hypothetical protein
MTVDPTNKGPEFAWQAHRKYAVPEGRVSVPARARHRQTVANVSRSRNPLIGHAGGRRARPYERF